MNRYIKILRSKLQDFIRAGKVIIKDPVLDDLQKILRFYYCWPQQKRLHWRMVVNWIQTFCIQWIPSLIFICRTKNFQLGLDTFCEMAGLELFLVQSTLISYHHERLNYLIDRLRAFWYRCQCFLEFYLKI